MNGNDIPPEQMRARIAFLENAISVAMGQRNSALDAIVDLTVQRDMAVQRAETLEGRLKKLEDRLKTG